jgi:hypothetical protein
VTPDHDRIEELLAGYALDALSGEDAREAEALLTEHVPTCLICRGLLQDYREVVGDLALAADPVPAPDLLLASLRRELSEADGLAARRRGLPSWMGAVAAAALLTLGGFTAFLSQRVSDADASRTNAVEAMRVMADPASHVVSMREEAATPGRASVVWKPGETTCYVIVDRIPRPSRRHEYQIWFTVDGEPVLLASTFLHRGTTSVVAIGIDMSRYDGVWIVQQREGDEEPPAAPILTAEV